MKRRTRKYKFESENNALSPCNSVTNSPGTGLRKMLRASILRLLAPGTGTETCVEPLPVPVRWSACTITTGNIPGTVKYLVQYQV